MKMTFEEYCEDFLDLQVGLMSDQALTEARASYDALSTRTKKAEKHPDLKLPVAELRARCERLVEGQKISIERATDAEGIAAARVAVEFGERLLAKRATKAEFVEHKELNSHASRLLNDAKRRAENGHH